MAQAQTKERDLTKKLHKYSAKYVQIPVAGSTYARKLVKQYIGDQVMKYCQKHSTIPIRRLEYAGSVYERLKTEAADEVDIMVVLKTTKTEVTVKDSEVPGYARLVPKGNSKFCQYVSDGGYINSERLRNGWFYSLVDHAVRHFRDRSPNSDLDMVVRAHGPAVQLDIVKKETADKPLLSVDLVPCFFIRPDSYYVAKPYTGSTPVSDSDLLWRQSFSLKEKRILRKMDKDFGCRHELIRIVKTIVNREPTSLGSLESYHLKTAFMHYIKEKQVNWAGRNSLGEHFVGFLEKLQKFLEDGKIPHYWLQDRLQDDVNILEGIDDVVLEKMVCRLKRILNSEAERDHIFA